MDLLRKIRLEKRICHATSNELQKYYIPLIKFDIEIYKMKKSGDIQKIVDTFIK